MRVVLLALGLMLLMPACSMDRDPSLVACEDDSHCPSGWTCPGTAGAPGTCVEGRQSDDDDLTADDDDATDPSDDDDATADDDDATADDDDVLDDDDSTAPDDDDDATADDDDAGPNDDDSTADDDDSSPVDDDDLTPDDDDAAPDDDDVSADDDDSVDDDDATTDDDDSVDDDDDTAPDDDDDATVPDGDGDGYDVSEDCDDADPGIHPHAGDTYMDGVDSDCDGLDCEAAAHGLTYFAACPASILRADAAAECSSGGHDGLATLLNAPEQAFVEALRPTPGSVGYWIGYSDIAVDDDFVWDSGLVSALGYEHWYAATEPNGQLGTDEDCVTFLSNSLGLGAGNGFWGDVFCASATHAYLCETRACEVTEVCDGFDADCDGQVDEGFDQDGDGVTTCGTDGVFNTADDDCDDADPFNAGPFVEVCDGADNDCDDEIDNGYDMDGDGSTTCAGDCDDNNPSAYPGAEQSCTSVDNDCDGAPGDLDVDGDGSLLCEDCDDDDPSVYPGAGFSICDGVDYDCDGLAESEIVVAFLPGQASSWANLSTLQQLVISAPSYAGCAVTLVDVAAPVTEAAMNASGAHVAMVSSPGESCAAYTAGERDEISDWVQGSGRGVLLTGTMGADVCQPFVDRYELATLAGVTLSSSSPGTSHDPLIARADGALWTDISGPSYTTLGDTQADNIVGVCTGGSVDGLVGDPLNESPRQIVRYEANPLAPCLSGVPLSHRGVWLPVQLEDGGDATDRRLLYNAIAWIVGGT